LFALWHKVARGQAAGPFSKGANFYPISLPGKGQIQIPKEESACPDGDVSDKLKQK
jgi:hypothetical protein